MRNDKAFTNWTEYYVSTEKNSAQLMWPCESTIHMMMGIRLGGGYEGKSVVDVGFGNGNNFPFYLSKNLQVSGVEVTEEICELVTGKFSQLEQQLDLRVGKNTHIPFDDNSFDLLVSWNAIHYESNEKDMVRTISEFSRVLKTGGKFIISTTGPQHVILEGSQKVGEHLYRIQRDGEFRSGEVFFCFESESEIRRYFEPGFDDIFVGQELKHLPSTTVDYFLVHGTKK